MSVPRFSCPHCKTHAIAIKSRPMGALMKETTYRCPKPECGHTFVCTIEVARTLSPSGMPDPSIDIPLSQHARQSEELAAST